jgi:hypothetical protein
LQPLPPLRDTAVFLYQERNGRFEPIGTGFNLLVIQSEMTFWYMVTCRHVVKPLLDTNELVYTRLNRSDRRAVAFEPLRGDWHFHPDPAVDLAVLGRPPGRGRLEVTAISVDALLTRQRSMATGYALSEGDEVFFSGLFESHMGEKRNMPILRFGHVSMVTDELIQGEYGMARYYLLEIQAYPFNSGSPVFVIHPTNSMQMEFSVAGVIAGFFPERQLPRIDETGRTIIFSHLGISSAVPADSVQEILNLADLKEARRKGMGAGRVKR